MRINCIVGPFLPLPPVLGGACEKIFYALCEEFARRGHEVTMISRTYAGFPSEEVINGVRHVRVRSRDMPGNKIIFRLADILYAWRIRKALPEADVTITNSVSAPVIIPRRKAGKIYVDVARYPKGQMALYRRVDRLQCCSSHIARAVIAQTPSVAHLVKTVPNALASVFAQEAKAPLSLEKDKQIVFVGRVAREKGIDLLIRAFALLSSRHPDWRLVVVGPHLESQGGDGEAFMAELKEQAAQSGAPIDFTGPVFDQQQLVDHFRRSAIFVYPSVAELGEAFPVAPLEAMACGCAPVVSDLGCFEDAITPGVHGLSFDHRDPTGQPLAQALEQLMMDEGLRRRFAEASRAKSQDYAPGRVAQLFLEDFAALTGLSVDGASSGGTVAVRREPIAAAGFAVAARFSGAQPS
ncbi:glycosyltransferase family 4 protein [Sphingobium mellinum]|uniref:glycosyltransferase family 4 protein n=1 Tax=Sphingobium mellinum TaxID=1387166 RepID=UPI0030EC710F